MFVLFLRVQANANKSVGAKNRGLSDEQQKAACQKSEKGAERADTNSGEI